MTYGASLHQRTNPRSRCFRVISYLVKISKSKFRLTSDNYGPKIEIVKVCKFLNAKARRSAGAIRLAWDLLCVEDDVT